MVESRTRGEATRIEGTPGTGKTRIFLRIDTLFRKAGDVPTFERRLFNVRGVVQGVGFRPFVYGLARRHELSGFVRNDGGGVLIEAEGEARALEAFATELRGEAPRLAQVQAVSFSVIEPTGRTGFAITESRTTSAGALVPPDIATCDDCLRELFDPDDRRYRHPFVNCTNCGPRFTITRAAPYDRTNTTMAGFPMCAECRAEYEDPADRRFHAEATCCPACGPQLSMLLSEAVSVLRRGAVLAVKGIGGYHFACLAGDESAVALLRSRKQREEKPFAVMSAAPESIAVCSAEELALLRSSAAPIVLLQGLPGVAIAPSVVPAGPWLGVMLPYSPLHHLLCAELGEAIVLTSGNRSDEPIAFDDDDARQRLDGIADAVLAHERPIVRRCEDSVIRAGLPIRRSRGYAPSAIPLPLAAAGRSSRWVPS